MLRKMRRAFWSMVCFSRGHDWIAKLRMPFGLSRPYCERCDTEHGAPKVVPQILQSYKDAGIRITGGG